MPGPHSVKFELYLKGDEIEEYLERVSIMEHDGGLPLPAAQIEALICVLRKRSQEILDKEPKVIRYIK